MENINEYCKAKTVAESLNEAKKAKKNWIKDAIKKPGSLKKELGLKKDEKLTKSKITKEISKLKKKDTDKEKPGVQLKGKDAKTYKKLNLAQTLAKLPKIK